jgi:hypothetical protein
MSCQRCGVATPNRLCRACDRDERLGGFGTNATVPNADTIAGDQEYLGADVHRCDLCGFVCRTLDALADHECNPNPGADPDNQLLADGGQTVGGVLELHSDLTDEEVQRLVNAVDDDAIDASVDQYVAIMEESDGRVALRIDFPDGDPEFVTVLAGGHLLAAGATVDSRVEVTHGWLRMVTQSDRTGVSPVLRSETPLADVADDDDSEDGPRHVPVPDGGDLVAASGEAESTGDLRATTVDPDLSKFQLRILAVLAEEARYGLAIKSELEDYYQTEVNHGRLYPNLDTLVEQGYVAKSELDKRTNQYALTREGANVVFDELLWITDRFGATLSAPGDVPGVEGGDR